MSHDNEKKADVERQDAPAVEIPAGKSARELAPEDVRASKPETAVADSGKRDRKRGKVATSAHAGAAPTKDEQGVRSTGNTDVPVQARIPRGDPEE